MKWLDLTSFYVLIKTHGTQLRALYGPIHVRAFEQLIGDDQQVIECMIADYYGKCGAAKLHIPLRVFVKDLKRRLERKFYVAPVADASDTRPDGRIAEEN